MKCERTECTNVSNKIYRKKSHLLSLSFFCKLTAATVLKLCKEHFPTEKPWGRDRVEKCDVTLPWKPNFWISTDPSLQRRPFASSNDGRSCNNARESHTFHAIHVRFFLANLQIFISSLSCKELYHGHLASWLWRDRASKRGNRLGESRKQKTKLQCTTLWRFRLQVFVLTATRNERHNIGKWGC